MWQCAPLSSTTLPKVSVPDVESPIGVEARVRVRVRVRLQYVVLAPGAVQRMIAILYCLYLDL